MKFRARIGVLVSALVAATVFAPPAQAVAPMQWGACPAGSLDPVPQEERYLYSCGTYQVPLDHDRPGRGMISLALMRRAASDSSQRIGSLFMNPGGPGASGWALPVSRRTRFRPEVLQRFDLVGFDPRGIDRSTPLRCFKTNEEFDEFSRRYFYHPLTQQEIDSTIKAFADFSDFCARNVGELLKHVSTKDVTRDLELLRRAVGDRQLNYVGFSYGSLIGATYVNLFPRNARAMVFEGSVDADLTVNNGQEIQRQRAQAREGTHNAFLDRCVAEGSKCAFSAGDPRAKFAELREHLRTQPITLPDGSVLTAEKLVKLATAALNDIAKYAQYAADLQTAYNVLHPAPTAVRTTMDSAASTPYDSWDADLGTTCLDEPHQRAPERIPAMAVEWEREAPTFGRHRAFLEPLICSTWPVKDPDTYRGPWDRKTGAPVLLFGNYHDSVVGYRQSLRMAEELRNTRLVSVDSFGHQVFGRSSCAEKIAADYLISLRLPEPGTVCQPNAQPF